MNPVYFAMGILRIKQQWHQAHCLFLSTAEIKKAGDIPQLHTYLHAVGIEHLAYKHKILHTSNFDKFPLLRTFYAYLFQYLKTESVSINEECRLLLRYGLWLL
jgi:hypothetical protein